MQKYLTYCSCWQCAARTTVYQLQSLIRISFSLFSHQKGVSVKSKNIFIVIVLAFLAGCASTHMKQYIGKDVREVIIENGPPIYAFDMGDGRRAFQFRWGGGSFVIPQRTTVTGSSTAVGGSGWYSGSAITSGGGVITSEGCVLTYFARWNEVKNAWIVTEYRVPKQLVC